MLRLQLDRKEKRHLPNKHKSRMKKKKKNFEISPSHGRPCGCSTARFPSRRASRRWFPTEWRPPTKIIWTSQIWTSRSNELRIPEISGRTLTKSNEDAELPLCPATSTLLIPSEMDAAQIVMGRPSRPNVNLTVCYCLYTFRKLSNLQFLKKKNLHDFIFIKLRLRIFIFSSTCPSFF